MGFHIKHNEFELQAVLFCELKKLFSVVKGEVKFTTEDGRRGARFDIVVFDNDLNPIFIIETKRTKRTKPASEYKQIQRYKKLVDCPVYLISSKDEMNNFLQSVKENNNL